MAIVPFLLMTVMALSLAPLAGYQGGWAGFRMNNINSDIMVQLELAPWNHYINIGYNKVPPHPLVLSLHYHSF